MYDRRLRGEKSEREVVTQTNDVKRPQLDVKNRLHYNM